MSTPSPALGNRTPEQLKVTELREELKKRGIQIKGLKKDLVDRLEEVLKQEESEQQKEPEPVAEDADAAPHLVDDVPGTPVTKRRSKGHAKEEESDVDVVADVPVLASEGTEITISVVEEPKPKSQEADTVPDNVAAAKPVEETTVAEEIDNVAEQVSVAGDEQATTTAAGPALEDLAAAFEKPVNVSAVDDEPATTTVREPALEDLVAELEQNCSQVVQEEAQAQLVEESGVIVGEAVTDKSIDIVPAVEKPVTDQATDIVPAVEKTVDENAAVTEEEVISTTFERTVTEEREVSVVPEDQNIATTDEEQTFTTSTRVETEITQDAANEVATIAEITTTVTTLETWTTVTDDEGVKPDTNAVGVLEGNGDETIEETPKEDIAEVVTVVETIKDDMVMDVDGGTEIISNVEEPKEETPMDVDADTQKGSKRKDAAVDGDLAALEPTKRRRWNSAKGDEDSKISGKDVTQPLELQEPVPSSNAPVPPAKVLTPKSTPPEKVAVTRTAHTRTEAAVNGEGQKTRVVPLSPKPATSSLKIDKFLRPFTFKAVTELLAQTGTVQDVWMDQIKTHCYVTYSSIEEATATRNALYNLQWPPQGGRLLTAEFVDPSEVKLRSDGEKAAAAAGPTATAAPSPNAITPRGGISANSKASKDGGTVAASGQPSTPAAGLLPPPPVSFSPRDRPKQEVESTPTLDDLFRKTRSKPHIYYLPLTAQEVADKVAARNRGAATKPGVKA